MFHEWHVDVTNCMVYLFVGIDWFNLRGCMHPLSQETVEDRDREIRDLKAQCASLQVF